nr:MULTISPECIES: hypothetical protein [unclassified Chamaesiphon]
MDKIELYRASIQALLQEHDRHLPKNNNDDVENELFFDVERDSPIGDALRTISTNAGGMAGIEKSV